MITTLLMLGCGPGGIILGDKWDSGTNPWVTETGAVDTAPDTDGTGLADDSAGETGRESGIVPDTATETGVVDTAETGTMETGSQETGVIDTAADTSSETGLPVETGVVDTGPVDTGGSCTATTWYADSDGDGYGDAGTTTSACVAPAGYVADSSDCDDADASWYWACTACERELVTVVGFSQDSVWPGSGADSSAQVYLTSGTSAGYLAVRWDWSGDDWVACGEVDTSGSTPEADMQVSLESEYLAFGWVPGTASYVSSSEITWALLDGVTPYANAGDIGGNAWLTP